MLLYPENIEEKLGFDKIRELLNQYCHSDLGKREVGALRLLVDHDHIDKLTRQTAEFTELMEVTGKFPSADFIDVSNYLQQASIEGAALDAGHLFEIKLSLNAIIACQNAIHAEKGVYPTLEQLAEGITIPRVLVGNLEKCIDDKGDISDKASTTLLEIRLKLTRAREQLRRVIAKAFKQAQSQGFSPDGASITIRSGRLVFPVAADHKRKISGFVHDYSASGQTVYLEPEEALESNNEIRALESEERREVYKILLSITAQIGEELSQLIPAYHFLAKVDLVQAKARLATRLGARLPKFSNEQILNWRQAKHPLLTLSLKDAGREVIPLDIALHTPTKILVISGPNAGGKSIALKTAGLLQYMFQCGLLIPISPDSEVGIFTKLFVDIGDQQSLENDLSTYSSHLANMKFFLDNADSSTLILIDEFGTGTEPRFGGAIAESILEAVLATGCIGVITTHYTNLKELAENHANISNGAMLFDTDQLIPLYKLSVGKPGSSFALEVARQMGLPETVVANAESKLGEKLVNLDSLLGKLEKEKRELLEKSESLEVKQREVDDMTQKYSDLNSEITSKRQQILDAAKQEAEKILASTNKEIEKTIRHIKENRAEKKETRKIRRKLVDFKEQIKPAKKSDTSPKPKVVDGRIAVGDIVELAGNLKGEILSIKGKSAEVSIGDLKTTVELQKLTKIGSREDQGNARKPKKHTNIDINRSAKDFNANLDVRGQRPEQAWIEVEKFLDQALLLGQSQVKIVHGRGSGALREHIRNQLRLFDYVEKFWDEEQMNGGSGVTVVAMK